MIEAVLFDGDQTLWDFERVMHDALVIVLDELRSARPGPFTDALSVAEIQHDRQAVAEELAGIEYNLARLRVLGFGRTLERLRRVEGGDEATDAELAQRLTMTYFDQRDRDPALFSDVIPCLDALATSLPARAAVQREPAARADGTRGLLRFGGLRPGPPRAEAGQGHLRDLRARARSRPGRVRPRGRPPAQRRGRGEARRVVRRVAGPRGRGRHPPPCSISPQTATSDPMPS